ncbi:MAG: hypothetical protein HXX13_09320 [Bacteroidetes bacterium]|nr:hypothetical protein [Bacteroidota bacterium]
MRKACLLVIVLICNAGTSNAQLSDLCSSCGALMEESFTKFSGLAGLEMESQNNYKRVASTFEIKNSSVCYIETSSIDTWWYAEFGAFPTLVEARMKIKSLQSEFSQCFPQIEFIEHEKNSTFLFLSGFKQTTGDGINFLNAELGIYDNYDEKYIPFFRMPENAATVHYFNLSNDQDASDFASGLRRLASEAYRGFTNVLGSLVLDDTLSKSYRSEYCLPGALECEIEETAVFKHFKAYFGGDLDITVAEAELRKLKDQIGQALGKKYVWRATGNGIGFIESTKTEINSEPLIEAIKEKETGNKFTILIRVNEQIE